MTASAAGFGGRGKFGAVALALALLLGGCADPNTYPLISQPLEAPVRAGMGEVARRAADAMLVTVGNRLRHREKILPASFVEEGNLEQSSALGRILAQQMASRFTQAGFSVVEIKLAKNISLRKGEGQFVLTRELEKIAESQKAHAVLAGSYVATKSQLFVNAQLIRLRDGVALASEDFTLPLTHDLRLLLGQK